MRKVKYRKKTTTVGTQQSRTEMSDFQFDGNFHLWTKKTNSYKYGEGETIIALVEIEDGTILEILPCNIKFIKE